MGYVISPWFFDPSLLCFDCVTLTPYPYHFSLLPSPPPITASLLLCIYRCRCKLLGLNSYAVDLLSAVLKMKVNGNVLDFINIYFLTCFKSSIHSKNGTQHQYLYHITVVKK